MFQNKQTNRQKYREIINYLQDFTLLIFSCKTRLTILIFLINNDQNLNIDMQSFENRIKKVFQMLNKKQKQMEFTHIERFKNSQLLITNLDKILQEITQSRQFQFEAFVEKVYVPQKEIKRIQCKIKTLLFNSQNSSYFHLSGCSALNLLSEISQSFKSKLKSFEQERKSSQQYLLGKMKILQERLQNQINLVDNTISINENFKQLNKKVIVINQEIIKETQIRQELEEKIELQFCQQINELKNWIDQEKNQREIQQKQLINFLKDTYFRIHTKIQKQKQQREITQIMLIGLIQKLVENIHKQMLI